MAVKICLKIHTHKSETHKTHNDGYCNFETESAMWADSVKGTQRQSDTKDSIEQKTTGNMKDL